MASVGHVAFAAMPFSHSEADTTFMDSEEDQLINLIARCALKDQLALKALYDKTHVYLNAVAYRIVNSNEASSEVLQEGFIQIWQNATVYRPHQSKPLTWMTSIVRYRALDRLDYDQRRAKYTQPEIDNHTVIEQSASTECPEADAENSRLSRHIETCMETLSHNIKRSIELAYVYGFSREEIGEQFSTSTNTVKSWLRRGSERLKVCLETQFKVTP